MKKAAVYLKTRFLGGRLKNDIIAGIIVALVSVPISMGYAQVAGLPPVYGLYGSLLPILFFAFISSTDNFVIGIDAMPAAIVGSTLESLAIEAASDEAMLFVPVMAFLTAVWLLIFYFLKAGKIVKYISAPVMGGFISGIALTIILMQFPKLFGGNAKSGQLFTLAENIINETSNFTSLSFILGLGSVIIILLFKKLAPSFPAMIIVMVGAGFVSYRFDYASKGVRMLPKVKAGLPDISFPQIGHFGGELTGLIMTSLTIALVVMAQSLLASNKYSGKKVNNNIEILGYAGAGILASLCGAPPINGSVSRTSMARQYGAKSQLMSLISAAVMAVILMFFTPYLHYLPVPVLTGIVMAALIGILEIKLALRLIRENKHEFLVFITAFLGVLVFGTVYGVIIGMLLSFVTVMVRAVDPPRTFLGMVPGNDIFFNMSRNKSARPLKNTIIYRFNGNLFFANADVLVGDIEDAVKEDTKYVIIDARGISNIDITATDRLVGLYDSLSLRGIKLYITEHPSVVNDELRRYGAMKLIERGVVRRTISLALRDAGLEKPYPLEDSDEITRPYIEASERMAELEWAFGEQTEEVIKNFARTMARKMAEEGVTELENIEKNNSFGRIGLYDEDELLDYLEMYLEEQSMRNDNDMSIEQRLRLSSAERAIIRRRIIVSDKLKNLNPKAYEMLLNHRRKVSEHIREITPETYARIIEHEAAIVEELRKESPELADRLKELYESRHRINEDL